MTGAAPHIPVLVDAVVDGLALVADDICIDGTFGAGGYSRAIMQKTGCTVIAIDRDPDAIAAGRQTFASFGDSLILRQGRFGEMDRIAAEAGHASVAGVALDLGVSSMQIDQAGRGFSFRFDGPLDMRMEQSGPDAAEVVNTLPEADLAKIIRDYGEERHARRVARAIAEARLSAPIETTARLAEIVRDAIPGRKKHDGIDPATRTFQALRIYVNDELGELERGMDAAERILRDGGRCAIVSFHSLEDRYVKRFFRDRGDSRPRGSRHMPDEHIAPPAWRLVTRRPITPDADEISANPRARSARLRIAERIRTPDTTLEAEGRKTARTETRP